MKIPDNIINEIQQKVNIVDVIGDYIDLEKRGRNYFACCPFHQEDTPSFSVSEEKQLFYCFGCHEGGNVFSFPMKHDGLSFQESVMHVAQYTDVDVSNLERMQSQRTVSPNQEYYDVLKFTADFYAYVLQTDKGKKAKQYLISRGISEAEIVAFQIGFAPDEQILAKLLEEKQFSLPKAREIGLLAEAQDMMHYFDTFRGRIVFPITDHQGNIVAFTGRILPELQTEQRPKYLHSPESKIFKKRELFYNYYNVRNEIKKQKEVFICEGIFDVIALYRAGIINAIATLGTAVTQEQITLLKKTQIKLIFVFDNDIAGKNATAKALELVLGHQFRAEVVTFWNYAEKDLDEFIQTFDAARLKQQMSQRMGIFDFYLEYYQTVLNMDNNDDRQEFVRKNLGHLAKSNSATKDFYYKKIIDITGYSPTILQEFIQKEQRQSQEPVYVSQTPETTRRRAEVRQRYQPKTSRQERCELLVIKGLCEGAEYIKIYQNNPILSRNGMFRKLIYEVLEEFRLMKDIDVSRLMSKLDGEEIRYLSRAIYLQEPMDTAIFQELLETLKLEAEKEYHKQTAKGNGNEADLQKKINDIQEYLEFKKRIIKS